MIWNGAIGFMLLAGLGICLAGCGGEKGRSYSYRYRITVAVRDHGELLTASNVVAVKESPPQKCRIMGVFEGSCMSSTWICGEATALKVRNGFYLFAQTRGPVDLMPGKIDRWRSSPTSILLYRLGLPYDWWKNDSGLRNLPAAKTPVGLEIDQMPQFSVLTRFNDPRYVSGEIDPQHLPAALGDDVKLESVTLQATDEEVTRGRIAKILPWLDLWSGVRDNSKSNTYRWRDYARCDMD